LNLTIERGPALAALRRLADVVDRKSTVPILGNIALAAEGGSLCLRATNLDMEASETFGADVGQDGALTLPADKLRDIVSNSETGSQISLALSENGLRMAVKSGRSRFNVAGLPAEDFPAFKAEDFVSDFTMSAKTLADMVTRVAWAMERSDTLPFGNVYLADQGDELHAVGAAQTGIALRREPLPAGARLKAMMTPRLVAHLIRWLGDDENEVRILVTGSAYDDDGPARLIRFEQPGSVLTSKLFDAPAYVDYLRHMPAPREFVATTDQDALKAAIKRVLIMSEEKSRLISLGFAPGSVSVRVRGSTLGDGEDEIAADYDGPEIRFPLSAAPLLDALEALKGDRVEIGFNEKPDGDDAKVSISAPVDPAMSCFLMKLRG
jgi:DNA polymerase-3 subunit beta